MSESVAAIIFFGAWLAFAIFGFLKKLGSIISIGGGFIVGLLVFAAFATLNGDLESSEGKTSASKPEGYVSQEQFGDKWPFTVPEGRVEHKQGNIALFHSKGQTWALNGAATSAGYPPPDPIWRDNPDVDLPGAKMNTDPLVDIALEMGEKEDLSRDGVKRVSGKHYVGCIDRDYYKKLMQYANQEDMAAYRRAWQKGIRLEICTRFSEGEEIFISDTALLSGLLKVRRKGESKEYWTTYKIID